jgi:hypothetical protein
MIGYILVLGIYSRPWNIFSSPIQNTGIDLCKGYAVARILPLNMRKACCSREEETTIEISKRSRTPRWTRKSSYHLTHNKARSRVVGSVVGSAVGNQEAKS